MTLLILALIGFIPLRDDGRSLLSAEGGAAVLASHPVVVALSFPNHERFVYARRIGETESSLVIELTRKTERGKTWYELQSKAPDEDAVYVLDATSLALLRSDVTTRSATTTIRRLTEVIEDKQVLAPDELEISATAPFQQRIRLIPFEEKPVYRLGFQGSQSVPGFSFALTVTGREKIAAGGRTWDCWKVEVGAKGVLGSLFGKSRYWYQADWPHILVKFEGPSSFPGSPMTRTELVSYSSQ
ncbi:MAG TPA: hypothetical protein VMV83_14190 [Rectinemataceae bacterium]|nr:hypothetical protein [Rectinemataceae bacterium]